MLPNRAALQRKTKSENYRSGEKLRESCARGGLCAVTTGNKVYVFFTIVSRLRNMIISFKTVDAAIFLGSLMFPDLAGRARRAVSRSFVV